MRLHLTDLAIRKLPFPKTGNTKHWDTKTPAFGVRCSPNVKSFIVMHGKARKLKTLGRYPELTLSDARRMALREFSDPYRPKQLLGLHEARQAYFEECEVKNRPATIKQYRHFLSQVDKPKLADVGREDIDISSQHAVMAWRVFFNWCMRNEYVDRNPFAHVPVRWTSRSRVLTSDEVKKLWYYDWPPYSDYIKLSILTGQRIGQWKNYTVDGDTITFPDAVMKNRQEHSIPLTDWTATTVENLRPFNGWSKAKNRIDHHTGVTGWVHHDCRRYLSTTMASLQVPLHVTEFILSHKGQVSGVAATYNRYNYLIEMREALAKYEEHLKTVIA